jgi:hypothetical protein
MMKRGWPNSTGCPFSVRIALMTPDLSASDFVHELHRFDDAERGAFLHGIAHLDKRLRPRGRRPINVPTIGLFTTYSATGQRAGAGAVGAAPAAHAAAGLAGELWVLAGRERPRNANPLLALLISSSAMPDVSTSSISVLSLRRSIELFPKEHATENAAANFAACDTHCPARRLYPEECRWQHGGHRSGR